MTRTTTRRKFILQAGLLGAGVPLLGARGGPPAPSSKLNIAGIGVGGKGWSDIKETSEGQNVVALCDVDSRQLERGRAEYPKARTYRDWRRLLEQRDVDAVTISTPDHMHAPIAMAAMALGKHVYVQKPLTHSVFEARQLRLAAARAGVATQMGNQHRSNRHMKGARHLVRSGAIGRVHEAHVWTDRPIWPQGMPRPTGRDAVPAALDWDLWLGVAPERAFVADTYHPFKWRGFWDFGTGALGDMGCHLIDPIVHTLELPAPSTIAAEGPEPLADTAPKWSVVRYRFAAKGDRPAVELVWYDGGKTPPPEILKLPPGEKLPTNGAVFVGEDGNVFVNHDSGPLLCRDDWSATVDVHAAEPDDHYMQWTNACKGEGATASSFDSAGPLTETVLLGNVAYRLGQTIEWDARTMTATNAPQAAELIRRDYRDGWAVDWIE